MFGDGSKDNKGELVNDFVLDLNSIKSEKTENDNQLPQISDSSESKNDHLLFMIYYRRDVEDYFFHFNNKVQNYYCFASIVGPHEITTGCIISIINDNFKFTVEEDNSLKVDHSTEGGKLTSK